MYNFKEIELEASKVLKKKDIKNSVSFQKNKELFSFLEGPPTANAPPGLHHLEVRTYKDVINKFKFMRGYTVPRKAGWDCHGLPVEVQIEKKLKLNSKKDILKYGEKKFIEECRESVFSYIEAWNKSTEKLGYLVDLENRYATLDNNYIESVWWSLKQLYDKGLLYEAHKVVPFCPRCETPLSTHEVALGYKNIKENSIIIKFKLKKENAKLLVFTTTPWTLPSNLAIAVNPKIDYVYVKNGETYIIAKSLVKNYFEDPQILKEIKGKELLGKEYEPLFDYYKQLKAFKIIDGDFVTEDDGTGLVHMAPAFGEVDYDVCKNAKLPFVQPVDENGRFNDEVPEYKGKFIKDTDKEITQRLEEENKLFKVIKYEHDYPFCWRCNSPLMYYAIKSWFIKVSAYRDKLVELNEKINWVPKHIKEGRFGEWLKNVKDWALSRKKFWGTPLPIWRCDCGNEEIIGSVKELKERTAVKFTDKEIDLHKPWIDNIKFKCKKCNKEMKRVNDVIDCWYDSGSASFAQLHYPFENKDEFKKRFPYDFISEAIDQTRGWFYTLHVLATILFDDVAYKNVICAGHIVDEKGEKMSKSKENILDPDLVLDTVGVDATRLQFCNSDIGSSKRFGIEIVKQEIIPFLNILWNTYQFYKQIDNSGKAEERIEDKWILSRLNSTIKQSTKALEDYQVEQGLYPIINFISNDLSRTYIKLIRDRDDKNVKNVIGESLDKMMKLLAPYAPNITEVIHKEFGKESIHLSEWPKAKKIDLELEKSMEDVKEVIQLVLAEREKIQLGIRWPLKVVEINIENVNAVNKLKDLIKLQINVKEVIVKKGKLSIKLDTKMTKELEEEGFFREITRRIQALRKKSGLKKEDRIKLYIKSSYDLSKFKNEIIEKVGAKKLVFNEIKGKHVSKEKIKDKEFEIGFSVY